MRIRSWWFIGALWAGTPALAQQAPENEGFFRPAPDPAINRPSVPPNMPDSRVPRPVVVVPEAAPAEVAAPPRDAIERELERAEREHEQARLEAMRRPPPAIVSPLDGSAPITSPLDGSARIISPLDR